MKIFVQDAFFCEIRNQNNNPTISKQRINTMMKKFVTFCLAIACMATATAANPVIKNLGEGKYSLEVGDISMTINGEGGGKILSYKYSSI